MIHREFLGWHAPFLPLAADWLLQRRDELARSLVLVPTSQAGRRLKESLAERAGALLAPRFRTPGSLLQTPEPAVAAPWAEQLAWAVSLQGGDLSTRFPALFPDEDEDLQWIPGFARELVRLRHRLQEAGHTIRSANGRFADGEQAGLWQDLAQLESDMISRLSGWGLRGRNEELVGGIKFPEGFSSVVLAGVTELPPLLIRALRDAPVPVSVLIAAPGEEQGSFSDLGIPLMAWKERSLPWPGGASGSVSTSAGPRDQALAAFRRVCAAGRPSNEVALGSADPETACELERVFTLGGWTAFNPSRALPVTGLLRWMRAWTVWLREGSIRAAADLLALPETEFLIRGDRMEALRSLNLTREKRVLVRPEDVHHALDESEKGTLERVSPKAASAALGRLEEWRNKMLGDAAPESVPKLLDAVGVDEPDLADAMREWWKAAQQPMEATRLPVASCVELMLSHLPAPVASPPDGRVIDVQGWLELLFEPGAHLVLCGMNEGRVPPESAPDPWLNQAALLQLGLISRDERVARDAFLFASLVESRRAGGRVDLLCAKTAGSGDPLAPSRLLMASPDEELVERVETLFQDVVPSDAGLVWQADFPWKPRFKPAPREIRVTSLKSWIDCPFRFYISHVLGASASTKHEPQWSAAMAGTVIHEVMERWGRDPQLNGLGDAGALQDAFLGIFDDLLLEQFGGVPPVAVSIQAEAIRQRLSWAAEVQAAHFSAGWRVESCEKDFCFEMDGAELRGRVDRVDRRQDDGRVLVIDYKSGAKYDAEAAHRKRAQGFARAHLPEDSPVFHRVPGNNSIHHWIDLQLPLYAAQLVQDGTIPAPAYFLVGDTKSRVEIDIWNSFGASELAAARLCAEWVVGKISAGVFWPPAGKPSFDSLAILTLGRRLEIVIDPESAAQLTGVAAQ
jgi:ATP-dependent helicase/nuclease subunit B